MCGDINAQILAGSGSHFLSWGYDGKVNLTVELDREEDGRWIAEALELPGVMCYGQTRDEAISNTEQLALEVIAHGKLPSSALGVSFTPCVGEEEISFVVTPVIESLSFSHGLHSKR